MAENREFSAIVGSRLPLSTTTALSDAIRLAAIRDLKECRLSREQVAEAITRMTGRNVTRSQIDAYVADSKPHRFPLDLLSVWVRVTESTRLLDLVCAEAGYHLADDTAHQLADFGRTVLHREKMSTREAALKAVLMERV